MNYRMISYILGWILIFEGLFLSVPMLTAIVYGESVLPSYLIAMGICFSSEDCWYSKSRKRSSYLPAKAAL